MRLNVLTAVSRPWYLEEVAGTLAIAAARASNVEVAWHWRMDLGREHTGGQALKNAMLDDIPDGWVWVLDDDTLVHPDILSTFEATARGCDAVIVAQRRTDGRILPAGPSEVYPGGIDVGQAFLSRELIGTHRIPEVYDGDGYWLVEVLAGARIVWVHEPLSLHNAISGVNVSV